MPFKKGIAKKGGRTSGTKNKKTAILDTFAKTICEGGIEKFKRELNKLDGREYINAFLTLFEYVQPKLSRMTVEGDKDKPLRMEFGYGPEVPV